MPHAVAQQIGALPPVASLFAAVLGANPVQHVLAAKGVLSSLPAASQQVLTGQEFFPDLISGPFHQGLLVVFSVAAALSAIAAVASLLRGGRGTRPAWPGGRGYSSGRFSPRVMFSSQPTTPMMIAPQNAGQNPVMWNGRFSLSATQLVSQSSSALTTSPISPSVRM